MPVPLQNLRFSARVLSQIFLAFSQVLQETPALAPSPTKKTAPQFLRRFHSKTCNVTLFLRARTQNLRPSLFLAICPFPTNPAKPATHPTKSEIILTPQFLRQKLHNSRTIPATKSAKLAILRLVCAYNTCGEIYKICEMLFAIPTAKPATQVLL